MSALPPKADIAKHRRDVRFVPKADIGTVTLAACKDRRTGRDWRVFLQALLEFGRDLQSRTCSPRAHIVEIFGCSTSVWGQKNGN
jgi:sulfur transfer protein SufE